MCSDAYKVKRAGVQKRSSYLTPAEEAAQGICKK